MSGDATPSQWPVCLLPTRAGYDAWAAIYDQERNPLVALEERHVAPLLGPLAGLRVLDVGCGSGRHALRMAASGAKDVTGIDFSQGMLDAAKRKPGADRVAFMQHDLATPLPFPDGRFDRVVCGLVVDHIADLVLLFGQMVRVCAPGGFVVVSTMHPAMMLKGVQARFTDPATGVETRPHSVPNQVSDYVMAALRAGATIDHMSEHAADEELAAAAPRAEKYRGWPMLLMLRFAT